MPPKRHQPASAIKAGQAAAQQNRPFAFCAALLGLFALVAYSPAIRGAFVFDDLYLPFSLPTAPTASAFAWAGASRPVLMFTYWMNYRLSGLAPFSYHFAGLLLHYANACLVYAIVVQLLTLSGTVESLRRGLSLFCAGLFLLHPVQTEAVAYVTGRSECLSALFAYAALAIFLYGLRHGMTTRQGIVIGILFLAGSLSKEQVLVLPFAFLLTVLYWPRVPGPDRKILLRLYAGLFLTVLCITTLVVLLVLPGSTSAGFHLPNLTWMKYASTEVRALWVYWRLFVLPFGQNADYDFPISRGLTLAFLGGLAGLLLVILLAVRARKRYPVASYGFFLFLLLLAPTSSFLPLADPLVERRLYWPFIGLLLVSAGLLGTWRYNPKLLWVSLAVILAAAGGLSYRRNQVWKSALALWTDTVAKSPAKLRPRFQLAYAYANSGDCDRADKEYQTAAALGPADYRLLVDWALAVDCAGHPEAAIARLEQAAALNPTAYVYSQIGLLCGREGRRDDAFRALNRAVAIDPKFAPTYLYRGILHTHDNNLRNAELDFRRAIALNPEDATARKALLAIGRSADPEPERKLQGFHAVSLSPSSGSGANQIFTAVYFHPEGPAKIKTARLLINQVVDGRDACYVYYDRTTRSLLLINDFGDNSTQAPMGTAEGRLENQQCQLDSGRSSATEEQGRLTVSFALAFKSRFAGAKKSYLYADDVTGATTGFERMGTWKVR